MKVPTYCRKCKKSIIADADEVRPLCKTCKEAEQ